MAETTRFVQPTLRWPFFVDILARMGSVGVAKDIYLEKFGLDATTFSLLVGDLAPFVVWSMVVLGFRKRWDRWHIIPQLAVYTTYIPLIVLAFWGAPYATDPTFHGNQKANHWWKQNLVSFEVTKDGIMKNPLFVIVFGESECISRWWFWCQTFFCFSPTWGSDPIWRAYFFKWVGSTTN